MKKLLFPQLSNLLHGGDYNPEQWLDQPEILEQDLQLMKQAGFNTVTLGVFSWSVYEKEEGQWDFDWLEQIINRLFENGIYTILATPSGARPAWLDEKYPEAMRTAKNGMRNKHGVRHNHCMSSLVFRQKVAAVDKQLALRFGKNPAIILWHISNEFGGECYCENCQRKFQNYLRERFDNDINTLNHEWWTTFWSHRFNRFEQIEAPCPHGEQSIHGLNLEWKRFTTWNTLDFLKFEKSILGQYSDIPVTANFMRLYPGLDYHELCKEVDIISWDGYPEWNNNYERLWETAVSMDFDHAVMRCMNKNQPFLLMESVPDQVNWHTFNKLKRPGVHRLASLQAVACGSDSVQYFQWRKSRGSYEQHHGAVLGHLGRADTRVFQEVAEVGEILKGLRPVAGSIKQNQVAIIYDWPNRWAIEDMAGAAKNKKYVETCREIFQAFSELGIEADVISSNASYDGYHVIVAPMLYLLKPGATALIRDFAAAGGSVVTTWLSGYVNEHTLCWQGGFPGDGLQDVFGLSVEELDTLYEGETNAIIYSGLEKTASVKKLSADDAQRFEVRDFCELVLPEKAEVVATYESDFYQGRAAVTRNSYRLGYAWHIAAKTEIAGLKQILSDVLHEQKINVSENDLPEGVVRYTRKSEEGVFVFWLNWTDKDVRISIDKAVVDQSFYEISVLYGCSSKTDKNPTIRPFDGLVCLLRN
jgi:beta-galactosidase